MSSRSRDVAAALLLALVVSVPFALPLLHGATFFFRDLSVHFLPLRAFALEGLAAGEVRFWNPMNHEGVPLSLPPVGYPLDLLQLLKPDSSGISIVLALHVPLAAVAFFLASRSLGLSRLAGIGGALLYALGGFGLSCLNLYVYLQAMAWAPLVVVTLSRAGRPFGPVVAPAVLVALILSTTGVEIAAQAVLWGCLFTRSVREAIRSALVASVGAALAAPVLLVVQATIPGTAREGGFPTEVVLAQSVHPLSLFQIVVGSFHGNLANVVNEWWGQNFFPRGFPYVLSLYLGCSALACAFVATRSEVSWRRKVLFASCLSLAVALGKYIGWGVVVDHIGPLQSFRFPVKAFFGVHLGVSFLATAGLHTLEKASTSRPWRLFLVAATALPVTLLVLGIMLETRMRIGFTRGFYPPEMSAAERLKNLSFLLDDSRWGALLCLAVAFLALLVLTKRLGTRTAVGLVLPILAIDLLRTGARLNPTTDHLQLLPSPEVQTSLGALRRRGRVFTCESAESPSWSQLVSTLGGRHERASFAMLADTLMPSTNVPVGIRTALSPDLTMLVPSPRTLPWQANLCRDVPGLVGRLRDAGVATIVALDRLEAPGIRWTHAVAPARLSPQLVHFHEVASPRPRFEIVSLGGHEPVPSASATAERDAPGEIEVRVLSPVAATLIVAEGTSPGWTATIDGLPAPITAIRGRLMTLRVPSGTSVARLGYSPPGLRLGVGVMALGAMLLGIWDWRRRRGSTPEECEEGPKGPSV